MPWRDGTGPLGLGPQTGRGAGWCPKGRAVTNLMACGWTNRWLTGMGLSLAAWIVRELVSPQGMFNRWYAHHVKRLADKGDQG